MNQESYNKSNKIISIPLFIPVLIIILILSIIIFINIHNLNSTVIAGSSTNILEDNNQNELEIAPKNEELLADSSNEVVEETIETNSTNNTTQNSNTKTATFTTENGEQYTVIGTLNIPSLGIEYPILSETSTQLLKVSLNKYWGAYPNEVGNMVVVGHNYKNNKFFSKLPNIEIGAIVKITDLTGRTLDYKVYATDVIDPYDNTCTSQLTNGQTEVTLITCYYENGNAHATKRFVAKARAN